MTDPNALTSSTTSKTYASFSGDINLLTEVPTSGKAPKHACRRIRINAPGSGALALQYADGSTDTVTGLQQSDELDVQAVKIIQAGTSVGGVTVFW